MTFLAQMIADRLILRPSTHRLAALGKERLTFPLRRSQVEVWSQRVGSYQRDELDLFVLKFQGTGGRAERATHHPLDCWTDLKSEIWSVNPPGYGGSTGKASVKTLIATAELVFDQLQQLANGRPILLMGNSLGTTAALYLAARYEVAGMILRNPPPLRQLIVGRYGWWNLWIGAMLIAQKVPRELCAVRNARQTTCPAVILSSGRDEVVPPEYQQLVIQSYGGLYRLVDLPKARHASSLNTEQQRQYQQHLAWLREQMKLMRQSPAISDGAAANC